MSVFTKKKELQLKPSLQYYHAISYKKLRDKVTHLDISHLGLTMVLPIKYIKPFLTELNCSHNKITELPLHEIDCIYLSKMEKLICNDNELTTLRYPSKCLGYHELKYLDCRNNKLSSLENLPFTLTVLHCENNNLEHIPNYNNSEYGVKLGEIYIQNNPLVNFNNQENFPELFGPTLKKITISWDQVKLLDDEVVKKRIIQVLKPNFARVKNPILIINVCSTDNYENIDKTVELSYKDDEVGVYTKISELVREIDKRNFEEVVETIVPTKNINNPLYKGLVKTTIINEPDSNKNKLVSVIGENIKKFLGGKKTSKKGKKGKNYSRKIKK